MKRMVSVVRSRFSVIGLSFFLSPAPTRADAQNIGLYADGNCTSCSLEIPHGETRTVFVSGPTSNLPDPRDFSGGEFRILGVPNGWTYHVLAAEGVLLFGDPLGPDGGAFTILDPPTGFCRLIFTFTLTATSQEREVILSFGPPVPPRDPALPCPTIILSDPPGSRTQCFDGGELLINSPNPCTVSVLSTSWQAVKHVYR